jgi:predicted membrane protein
VKVSVMSEEVTVMSEEPRNPLALVVGTVLIAVGVLAALDRTGVIAWSHQRNLWPLILIAIGLAQLTYTYDARPRRGFALTLVGSWLLLYELGVMPLDNSWPLVLVAIGVAMAWDGWSPGRELSQEERVLRERRRGELLPLMVIGLIVAALLVGDRGRVMVQGSSTSAETQVMAVLGGNRHVSYAHPFRGADVTAFMGGAVLDLRNTTIEPGQEVTVNVFTMMGGSTLYVPREWIVDTRALAVLGGVEDRRFGRPSVEDRRSGRRNRDDQDDQVDPAPVTAEREPPADSPSPPASVGEPTSSSAPRLVIRGLIAMGGLVIRL